MSIADAIKPENLVQYFAKDRGIFDGRFCQPGNYVCPGLCLSGLSAAGGADFAATAAYRGKADTL